LRLRLAPALGAALALALALPTATVDCKQAPVMTAPAGVVTLDARHEPLRTRFDAVDAPRLVMLASPT
jgi:hypothetical protein